MNAGITARRISARHRVTVAEMVAVAAVALTLAEALVASGLIVAGLVLHSVVFVSLVNAYALSRQRGHRRDVFLALSLVPLLRLASVTLALPEVDKAYRLAVVGPPLLLAICLQAWVMGLETLDVVIRPRDDLAVGLLGLPLGLVGYLILRPAPLLSHPSVPSLVVVSLLLLVFTGVVEEAIFRWLILRTLAGVFFPAAPVVASIIYAATYLGVGSAGLVVFAGVAGLAACVFANRTGSLLGLVLAHGLASIGMLLVWPLLI